MIYSDTQNCSTLTRLIGCVYDVELQLQMTNPSITDSLFPLCQLHEETDTCRLGGTLYNLF